MKKKKKISHSKICRHGCGCPAAPKRTECYKCRSRGIRDRKPIDMVFYWIKKSAKKRHLEFTLNLVWFRAWVIGTGYMDLRGRESASLNIDRIDNLKGYTPDNIQVLTKKRNVEKYHYEDAKRELGPQYECEDLPF